MTESALPSSPSFHALLLRYPFISPTLTSPGIPQPTAAADDEPPSPTDLADQETEPEADPNGTVGLARILLAREAAPGWKQDLQDDVEEWQGSVGLKPDGKFGINSVKRMAEEVGILPLVRFWSLGKHFDKKSAIKDHRKQIGLVIEKLKAKLPASAAHIRALEHSMEREQAQGFPQKPPAVPVQKQVDAIMRELEADSDEDAAALIERVA